MSGYRAVYDMLVDDNKEMLSSWKLALHLLFEVILSGGSTSIELEQVKKYAKPFDDPTTMSVKWMGAADT